MIFSVFNLFNFKNKTDFLVAPGSFARCGFQYVKKESRPSKAGVTHRYNCSSHRKGCKATISMIVDSGGKRTFKEGTVGHTCNNNEKIEQGMTFIDERPAMKARIEEIVVGNAACGAKATAREVMKEFVKKNEEDDVAFEFYSVDQTNEWFTTLRKMNKGVLWKQSRIPTYSLWTKPIDGRSYSSLMDLTST
jgi:hypothetical protein